MSGVDLMSDSSLLDCDMSVITSLSFDSGGSCHNSIRSTLDFLMDWCDTASAPTGVLDDVNVCPRETMSENGRIASIRVELLPDDIPSWVHIYQSKYKSCSQRTQAASIAHIAENESFKSLSHNAKRRKMQRILKKQGRLDSMLEEVVVPPLILANLITSEEIKEGVIVFDGGDRSNPPILKPNDIDWRVVRIIDEELLFIADELDPSKGLIHRSNDGTADFIRMPRRQSLRTIPKRGFGNLFDAIKACEKSKGLTLKRGKSKWIFGDNPSKSPLYTSVGVQPHRSKRVITPVQPHMARLPTKHWNQMTRMMRWSEGCLEMMGDHKVLHHIRAAGNLVRFPTFKPSPTDKRQSPARYYGAIAFGSNVFLRCHIDEDYTYSCVQVHVEGMDAYSTNDEIVAYFCFPTRGIAVALRPADFLIFNPTIPHCISSRCRNEDTVLSVASYLKTSVVGLNNNQLELTEEQKILLDRYREMKGAKLRLPNRGSILKARYGQYYTRL